MPRIVGSVVSERFRYIDDEGHYFMWLGYRVTEDEYTLLWARLESDWACRAARIARHVGHAVTNAAEQFVRWAEKRRAEHILGRKLTERAW